MAAPVLILDETDSTNAEARRRAEAGEVGPLWITARLTNETLSGTADGVEADGSLRLKLPDGSLRVISAGDVFFGEAA